MTVTGQTEPLVEDNEPVQAHPSPGQGAAGDGQQRLRVARLDWRALLVGLAGFLMLLRGLTLDVPGWFISDPMGYIKGDAYNYVIEASLRGGEISGALASQAMYVCTGVILLAIGLLAGRRMKA